MRITSIGVRSGLALAVLVLLGALPAAAASPLSPRVQFSVFVHTDQNMASIVWTGSRFLYVENTKNTVWAGPASGLPVDQFSSMPALTEETRCILSPGTHGFPAGVIFCHSPDDKIYEISGSGGDPMLFATLPVPPGTVSDGALAFDNVGKFGYRLVAATGRSGAGAALNGTVYTIDPAGAVEEVGAYQGPGADEVAIAPSGFGSIGGDVLLGEDGGNVPAALVAMDPTGATRTVVQLALGLNPIIPIPKLTGRKGLPHAGVYITDDETGDTYFAAAAQFAPYAGDILIASEGLGRFWILEPHGQSFRALPVRHNAIHAKGIEGGIFVP
jgi:hypothetical protein